MKRRLCILALLLAIAALAYGVSHWCFMRSPPDVWKPDGRARDMDPLVWMQREFHLDLATLEKVRTKHESYQPTCGEMCLGIAKANARVRLLLEQSRTMTTELAEAIREAQLRQADCRTAMLRHIYEPSPVLQ